jgi:hypothetical protein
MSKAQLPRLSQNAPDDRPVMARSLEEFENAIAPYVAQAKATYPQAKQKFLSGLPEGEFFFLTTQLVDKKFNFEQVFVAVESIHNGQVTGKIASEIMCVKGYRLGNEIIFPEIQVVDWLITKPDGSEEGNIVGKFLDTCHA